MPEQESYDENANAATGEPANYTLAYCTFPITFESPGCTLEDYELFYPIRPCVVRVYGFDGATWESSWPIWIIGKAEDEYGISYITDSRWGDKMCGRRICLDQYIRVQVEPEGVYFIYDGRKDLYYRTDVEEGEKYQTYSYGVTAAAMNKPYDLVGMHYERCNIYQFTDPANNNEYLAEHVVCYNWGVVKYDQLKLFNSNVDEMVDSCEVGTQRQKEY